MIQTKNLLKQKSRNIIVENLKCCDVSDGLHLHLQPVQCWNFLQEAVEEAPLLKSDKKNASITASQPPQQPEKLLKRY